MTDFENRARSAGTALRDWTPDGSTASPNAAVRRAVHRTRVHRATAGGLLAAVLGGVGLLWGPSTGDDVQIGSDPAATTQPTTPTTDAPDPTTATTPTTIAPDNAASEPTETTTTTPTTTEAPVEPVATSCSGQVRGSAITFEATLPTGWHHNEAALGEPACHYFGPEPIELRPVETEADMGVGSNAAVVSYLPHGCGQLPTTFDQSVESSAASSETTSTQRATVDGHAAARFERVTGPGDGEPVGGEPFVQWTIDLGDCWLDAVTTLESVSYEEAAAAIDQIIRSLDFSV